MLSLTFKKVTDYKDIALLKTKKLLLQMPYPTNISWFSPNKLVIILYFLYVLVVIYIYITKPLEYVYIYCSCSIRVHVIVLICLSCSRSFFNVLVFISMFTKLILSPPVYTYFVYCIFQSLELKPNQHLFSQCQIRDIARIYNTLETSV